VIAEHTGHRQIQFAQAQGQTHIPIGQIPHHKQGIWGKIGHQTIIVVVPLAMEISGDGQLQHNCSFVTF
jgi:hypothetical protein